MTGAYLRVERQGKFYPIEVEFLTPEERRKLLVGRSEEELMRWMDMLCETIVEMANDFH